MIQKYFISIFIIVLLAAFAAYGQEFSSDSIGTKVYALNAPNSQSGQSFELQQTDSAFCCQKKYFWFTAGEIIALQIIPNFFNRHVSDDSTAVLSVDSWKHNIETGFEWDPNNFAGNMFSHPFHGNVFFNAARSNGYSFWGSAPFAFAGSFIWEMFGENNRGAINDWAMTSLGGITIGEGLHRAAKMLRDNTARGAGRAFREIGGFLLDPVGGFNRAARGEMSKIGPNPQDRFPSKLNSFMNIGSRIVGDGRLNNADPATAYFALQMFYGDVMEDYKRPFDAFRLAFQLNGEDTTTFGLLQIWCVLFGTELRDDSKVKHVFTIDQMYDYANNRTYEVGGQSFAFSLRSRWFLSNNRLFQTLVQPSVYIMTGIVSEFTNIGDRNYDFGSGFGFRVTGTYGDPNNYLFGIGYRGIYSYTLNGTKGTQIVHFGFAHAKYRLWRSVGIGADYIIFMRDSFNRNPALPDTHSRNPELRLSLSFFFNTIKF